MLTLTWITSIYFVSRRCICSYVSFTSSEKNTHSHTEGLYIFKGNNCILWSFCLQKMFVKRWSEICCCHCNATMKLYRHLKSLFSFREAVCGGRLSLERKWACCTSPATSWTIVFVSSNTRSKALLTLNQTASLCDACLGTSGFWYLETWAVFQPLMKPA